MGTCSGRDDADSVPYLVQCAVVEAHRLVDTAPGAGFVREDSSDDGMDCSLP
jgi:hypothetical protein